MRRYRRSMRRRWRSMWRRLRLWQRRRRSHRGHSMRRYGRSMRRPQRSALRRRRSRGVTGWYRRGVSGDCGVGITPQMCNRVTNHGDMSTFSTPGTGLGVPPPPVEYNCCVSVFSKHRQGRPKNIATDWWPYWNCHLLLTILELPWYGPSYDFWGLHP